MVPPGASNAEMVGLPTPKRSQISQEVSEPVAQLERALV
jgi:acetolactate synthase-1/2/3 large subunit